MINHYMRPFVLLPCSSSTSRFISLLYKNFWIPKPLLLARKGCLAPIHFQSLVENKNHKFNTRTTTITTRIYHHHNNNSQTNMDKYLIKNKRLRIAEEEAEPVEDNVQQPSSKKAKVDSETLESNNKSKGKEKQVSNEESGDEGDLDTNTTDVSFDKLEQSLDRSWRTHLSDEFNKKYFKDLKKFLVSEAADIGETNIFPPKNEIFNAFNHCKFDNVKVVILGQDPYQTPKYAHGLAFSVKPGVTVPKSLINIYKELETDIKQFKRPKHGNLISWADQGVLLLNTVLTVKTGVANSHQKKGWEQFTDAVIDLLNKHKKGLVFMLWGKPAQTKGKKIDRKKHHVLECAHPSPLSASRGFFGCKHFSKCNKYLKDEGMAEIDWQV